MKKDIRNVLFISEPTYIIFNDYTQYVEFCNYANELIEVKGYVSVFDVLEFIGADYNFKNAYTLGWFNKDIQKALNTVENHKYKKKFKTDGTWPICMKLPEAKDII
ncbi:MAG: hypothetical protein IJ094_13105 [Bacilli bacterium]|nr:hypothetical protein [Bacilli bacterium]